ncbi:D-alanyl-D-alanine carboxypeptidase/D-alanyl-D-alanine-endopeptidase [Comamonas faecalis]|uniref:D-alanyl-D-alanine carboxypeptidase/D-alanyl-D-alanine-endopeptidase n=1 Tax=Comamonas faecalis TaxID=1387849 RepID=A0ABP7QTR2_9BURK
MRPLSLLSVLAAALCLALAAPVPAAAGTAATLPAPVLAALQRAKLPAQALSVVVAPASPGAQPLLAWRADTQSNPASVMKLVTTYAALELLGPAYTWPTTVYLDAQPVDGRLQGNVYIRGQGDPQLVVERLWLLMQRLRAQGVTVVMGDIVLDRSAFVLPTHDAAAFDDEPWRPYNAAPDALLINFKSLTLSFTPDTAAGVARIAYEPPLAGVQLPVSVALAPAGQACGDWRAQLQPQLGDARQVAFAGSYPASCGAQQWHVAPADPGGYGARAIEAMWREVGGALTGQVREGSVPPNLAPALTLQSPPLAEVIRSINKYSNNVMTQQLFLTMGLQDSGVGSFDGARAALARWWSTRIGGEPPQVDNGAGLSRDARISADALARMLQQAWASPVMPELVASLPIAGVDGTLRRRKGLAVGRAHLKTGSLRDVASLAGFVDGADGQRYVLVALVNHEGAAGARAALDALIDWTATQGQPNTAVQARR